LSVAKLVLFTPLKKFDEAYGSPPIAPSIVNRLNPFVFLLVVDNPMCLTPLDAIPSGFNFKDYLLA